MRHKILFILKNSKTKTTGYYQMNSYVKNSEKLKKEFIVKVINLYSNSNNKLISLFKLFIYSCSILFTVFTYKPNLIYFTISPVNTFHRDLFYVFILKLFKIKLVYHLHGKGIEANASKNKINFKLYNWAFKNVNVILVSEKLKYDIEFLPLRSIYILPNAIPKIPFISSPNQDIPKENSPIRLLFLSNLIKSKGVFDFIEAVKILKKQKFNIRADIVGREADIKEYELYLRISSLEDVLTFHGPLYGDEKNSILKTSDVLIFPTMKDIWGIVILEAMQFGLTIITTDEGAITDMIENEINGFIVEKNNPQQIAEKIKFLIDNPNLIQKMGIAAKEKFLRRYTLDIFEENMLNIFNKIIKSL